MSEPYDIKESTIIDDKMLKKALEEQGPQMQAGLIAKEEGIKYSQVTQLCLEYRNISKIDLLWQLMSLTKLQLNNNYIEKIQGLESLTNLEWLDLSFNSIEVIEGLDTLEKLQDLNLFNNRISVIENMDMLQNLQILSLGNNLISHIDNVIYLRRFKDLHTLDLAGNPICEDENHQSFVVAYLSNLVYLDYKLLDEQTRECAKTKHELGLERVISDEQQEQEATEVQRNVDKELQLHKNAFVENLNGHHLFASLFVDDVEASKLALLPEVSTLLETYRTQLLALCMQIFEAGLTQQVKRQNEVECFFIGFQKTIGDNQQRGAQIVTDFERSRRQIMTEILQAENRKVLKDRIRTEVMQIRDTLLTLEQEQVDQLEEIIEEFEINITDMVGGLGEYVRDVFVQCRDLENHHNENVLKIVATILETLAKKELEKKRLPDEEEDLPDEEDDDLSDDVYLPDDVRLLFVDKDTVMNVVRASHDTRLLKIDNRESELLTRIENWKSALLKSIYDEDIERNHKRISEIHKYVDFVLDQLKDLVA